MKKSIAIVGRTNVGKSLLFNKLTRAKKSLFLIGFPDEDFKLIN